MPIYLIKVNWWIVNLQLILGRWSDFRTYSKNTMIAYDFVSIKDLADAVSLKIVKLALNLATLQHDF